MEKNAVQSLERAFSIIEQLSAHKEGLQLTALSVATDLHKSTVHRLLLSLTNMGYVKKEGSKYKLSLKLFEIGSRCVENLDILHIASSYLDRLSLEIGETVHLVLREDIDIVYIYKVESNENTIRMASRIGMRRQLYCTAVGKCILSNLSKEEVFDIWQRSEIKAYTDFTITDLPALWVELAKVKSLGYALDNEENELGVRCIAAPIFDYTGHCHHAFSISAPLGRMSDARIAILAEKMTEFSQNLSAELGYRPVK